MGIGNLKQAILKAHEQIAPNDFVEIHSVAPTVIDSIQESVRTNSDYATFQVACNYQAITHFSEKRKQHIQQIVKDNGFIAKRFVLKPILSPSAIDSSVVPVFEHSFLKLTNSLSFIKNLEIG